MLLKNLKEIVWTTDRLIKTFGAHEDFKKEFTARCLEIDKIICKEFSIEKTNCLEYRTKLRTESELAAQKLKNWIANNYQFPK